MQGGYRESCIIQNDTVRDGYNKNDEITQSLESKKDDIESKKKELDGSCYRIRKLTPLECWRLQGFEDEDFKLAKAQGVSDSQLYKQAGNSITTNVLYYIFKNLFKEYIIN